MRDWKRTTLLYLGSPLYVHLKGDGWAYEDSGEYLVKPPRQVELLLNCWNNSGVELERLGVTQLTGR